MTYPTAAVVTTNLDGSGDSPATARSDLLDAVQKLNEMIAHTTAFAATILDDTNAAGVRGTIGAAASGSNTDITSITGNAATATTAGTCTGNAATVTNGVYTTAAYTNVNGVSFGTGSHNDSSGVYIGSSCTSGTWNTSVGYQSMGSGANSSCNFNVAIGNRALWNITSGDGNIAIGPNPGIYGPVFDPTTESNRICMGSTYATNAYIQVAWTVVSDARDKMNLAQVPHGLAFVNALQPTAYQFKKTRDDATPHGPVRYGFKAQDVLALEGANPVIVDAEDPKKLRMVDQHLMAVMVKAIQELSAKVVALEARP